LDRIIGIEQVKTNLRIIMKAVVQFWRENRDIWQVLPRYENQVNRDWQRLTNETGCINAPLFVPWRNPAVVPEI
jgi:hypothetical protein